LFARLVAQEYAAYDELEQLSERDQTLALKALAYLKPELILTHRVGMVLVKIAPFIMGVVNECRTFTPPPGSEWAALREEAEQLAASYNPER
jgi:hypothetical protein